MVRPLRLAGLLVFLLVARPARAQQIDAHISYVPGDGDTHYPLVGAGVGIRKMFDVNVAYLGARLGADYAREEHLGPGRGSAGLDLTLAPHGDLSAFVPYAGVGLSLNWSGGVQSAWDGYRRGVDGIVGVDIALFGTDVVGMKLEERYGSIAGLPRASATRLGLIVGF